MSKALSLRCGPPGVRLLASAAASLGDTQMQNLKPGCVPGVHASCSEKMTTETAKNQKELHGARVGPTQSLGISRAPALRALSAASIPG